MIRKWLNVRILLMTYEGPVFGGLGEGFFLLQPGAVREWLSLSDDGVFFPYVMSIGRGRGGMPLMYGEGVVMELELVKDIRAME